MRIVGGIYKGRVLCDFQKIGVRPTSDMARESLFNILQLKINGASFLDLFSGTGAMGIEALSRGAKRVVLNDFSRDSIKLIKSNLQKLKIEEGTSTGVTVSTCDGVSYLQHVGNSNEKFDVIFLDPPYQEDLIGKVAPYICNALTENGIAIIESETPLIEEIFTSENLTVYDTRRYGRARLTFVRKV